MFRKACLCALMCLLLVAALAAGAGAPVIVILGGLMALALGLPLARGEQQG